MKNLFCLFILLGSGLFFEDAPGQPVWMHSDSIFSARILSHQEQINGVRDETNPFQDILMFEIASTYLQSGLLFTADTLVNKYLNRYYPSISLQSQRKFHELNAKIDSSIALIKEEGYSRELIKKLEKELRKPDQDTRLQRNILYNLAQIHFSIQDYAGFIVWTQKALELSDSLTRPELLLDKLAGFFYLRQLDSALTIGQEALGLFEGTGDLARMSNAHTQLATVFFRQGKNRRSLYHYQEAMNLAQASQDILAIDVASNYLAIYYELIGKPEKAIPILREIMARKSNRPIFGSPFDTPNESISQFDRAENAVAKLVRQRQLLFILIILVGSIGIIIALLFRLRAKKREAELLQQINRIQINPHFIFNSLNSLQRFIIEDDIGASNKYLTRFSSLIRSVLNNTQENYIPVFDEIKFLEDYLALEKLRFKNHFSYEVEVSQNVDVYNMLIPTMIIQPFIENSLWHGLIPKEGPGTIQIRWEASDLSCLRCTIIDDGIGRKKAKELKGKSSKKNSSVGTKLIKSRLDQLSKVNKSSYHFDYEDLMSEDGLAIGTKVIISIPLKWKKIKKR